MRFMLDEINSEPAILTGYEILDLESVEKVSSILKGADMVYSVGNGSSHNAAEYLSILLNRIGINCLPLFSSEVSKWLRTDRMNSVSVVFSQSGNSVDAVNSVEFLRSLGSKIIGVTNTRGSRLSAISDVSIHTDVGEERSVAATKSHLAQLIASLKITERDRDDILSDALEEAAVGISTILDRPDAVSDLARSSTGNFMFLGSGLLYPVCMESALKLTETSNIPSIALPLREILHGPVQILDDNWSVFLFTVDHRIEEKIRGYSCTVLSVDDFLETNYGIHASNETSSSMISLVFAQLFSFFKSIQSGLDPDRPSKLSKVVF